MVQNYNGNKIIFKAKMSCIRDSIIRAQSIRKGKSNHVYVWREFEVEKNGDMMVGMELGKQNNDVGKKIVMNFVVLKEKKRNSIMAIRK